MTKTEAFAHPSSHGGGAQTPSQDPVLQAVSVTLEELLRPLQAELASIRETLRSRRKDHYTVEEVADLTGRTPYTVRRWISEKRIKAIRISGTGPKGRLLIAREEVDGIINSGLGGQVPDAIVDRT